MSANLNIPQCPEELSQGQIFTLSMELQITDVCLFNPVIRIFIRRAGEEWHALGSDTHQGGFFFPWLPRGIYDFEFAWPVSLAAGDYQLGAAWGTADLLREVDHLFAVKIKQRGDNYAQPLLPTWSLSEPTRIRIAALSWQKGMDNWFHRHFCHAAEVIGKQFMANSEKLRGRVLDIGAGDGITDLGLVLRHQPQELVAMDIVGYMQELPRVAQENDLPLERLPDNLVFLRQSCEQVPYADNSFDVVISWGSVEHIVGGYAKTLEEVWRVLKPGGLFFVNPGLYYSAYGSHLGEFSDIPHLHLTVPEQQLHELVMTATPKIMDRAGFNANNADYWRFYKELNPITVAAFETQLKARGYNIIRAALRVGDVVEYTAELQKYSILDLGIEDAFFTLQKPETA